MRLLEINGGVPDYLEKLKPYKETIYNYANIPLYRGVSKNSNMPVIFVDPIEDNRKSLTGNNIFNLLLDILPSWEGLPRRTRSHFCTTNTNTAEMFGRAFRVIPLSNPSFVIMPHRDNLDSKYTIDGTPLTLMNIKMAIAILFDEVLQIKHNVLNQPNSNYDIGTMLKETQRILKTTDIYDTLSGAIVRLLARFFIKSNNIIDSLSVIFSPYFNGIRVTDNPFELKQYHDNEVFFEGRCLLVEPSNFKKLIEFNLLEK